MHDVIITGGKAVPTALFIIITIACEDRNGTIIPGEMTAKQRSKVRTKCISCRDQHPLIYQTPY